MKKSVKNATVNNAIVEVVDIATVEVATVDNANKVNTNIDFVALYNILHDTVANKNVLRIKLNNFGLYATMKTKNTLDMTTTTPNDYYYQLIDGTRILINAKRTKFQIWSNVDLVNDNAFSTIYNGVWFDTTDSGYRNKKTDMSIPFTVENLTTFIKVMIEKYNGNILPTM